MSLLHQTNMGYDSIIFDLDGTLLDTSLGIFNSVRYVEKEMGLERVSDDQLRLFVGPPPKKMYKQIYGLTEENLFIAVKKHRFYGGEYGYKEARVYPNMLSTLCELKKSGYKLGVATLKKQTVAEKVLNAFELDQYFDCIVGMNDEETLTKRDTIKMVMQKMNVKKPVMVGDSQYDLEGAIASGIDFIAALYGFGCFYNLNKCVGIEDPQQLLSFLA